MQVTVFCRFSYPALGGFQVVHETTEQRRAYLYEPQRLATRLALFEQLCLPSWKAQTDPDFVFVVLVGSCLPEAALTRLQRLVSDFPQSRILAREPGPHRKVCRAVLNSQRVDPDAPCLQVRHDDDDAVSLDFIETLRAAARDVQPLLTQNELVGFDWNHGHTIRSGEHGIEIADTVTPFLGVAQAVAIAGGNKQSVMNFGHSKLSRYMPTVTFNSPSMYLRSHNAYNDSRQKPQLSEPEFRGLTDADISMLENRFAITADGVQVAFSPVVPS